MDLGILFFLVVLVVLIYSLLMLADKIFSTEHIVNESADPTDHGFVEIHKNYYQLKDSETFVQYYGGNWYGYVIPQNRKRCERFGDVLYHADLDLMKHLDKINKEKC